MKKTQNGFIVPLLLAIIAILLAGGVAYLYTQKKSENPPVVEDVALPLATSTIFNPSQTSISFPPIGWYVHDSSDIPALGTSVMLTKQNTYVKGFCEGTEWACYGEQIDILSPSITLTPEQFIAKIIQNVYPSVQKWDTLNGQKIFSMTYTTEANATPTDAQYLFVGDKVYQFLLYPSNEKNYGDLVQVVEYYSGNIITQTTPVGQTSDLKTYTNTKYGFSFSLPTSWVGYSIITNTWRGYSNGPNGDMTVATGLMVSIRHPLWTSQNPRQDIPIMIFTIQQWNDLQEGKFNMGAAPIGPSELGRNANYVFALPARYNYASLIGWEEVGQILNSNPLHAF